MLLKRGRSGGREIILKHLSSTQKEDILPFIKQYLPEDAEVHTDEYRSYGELGKWYTHETIDYSFNVSKNKIVIN